MEFDGIKLDAQRVRDFCQRHRVARLAVFGSRLRGTAKPDSDLDLLVEFQPGSKVSLFDVGGMMSELSESLGVQVDIRTARDLSPLFRDKVLREARTVYVAA